MMDLIYVKKKILNEANWQFHLIPTRMNEHHKDVKQKQTIKKKKKLQKLQMYLYRALAFIGKENIFLKKKILSRITRQLHVQTRKEILRQHSIRLSLKAYPCM